MTAQLTVKQKRKYKLMKSRIMLNKNKGRKFSKEYFRLSVLLEV